MLTRLLAAAIVIFWLVMTTLLVRLEMNPAGSKMLDVPVAHVVKLMLERGQQSVLTIRENDVPAGTLMVRPSMAAADGGAFEFSGGMSLRLPLAGLQRITWSGTVTLDPALRARSFHLDLALRNPPCAIRVDGEKATGVLSYEVRSADQPLASGTLPLDAAQAVKTLAAAGVDASGLAAFRQVLATRRGDAAWSAKQAVLPIRGERLEVYEIALQQDGTALADIFVSQLGQVLLVKTAFGCTLSAEGLP